MKIRIMLLLVLLSLGSVSLYSECDCVCENEGQGDYEDSKVNDEPPEPPVSWPGKDEDAWFEEFTKQ